MTDSDLNEQVARKLGTMPQCSCTDALHKAEATHFFKDYCHSIEAAFEIPGLESLIRLADGRWSAEFGDGAELNSYYEIGIYEERRYPSVIADTAPMAITLAFLKLSEAEK